MKYTYGVTIGGVLHLGLVKLHLLLLHNGFDFSVLLPNDLQQIFGQNLRPLNLAFVRSTTGQISR